MQDQEGIRFCNLLLLSDLLPKRAAQHSVPFSLYDSAC